MEAHFLSFSYVAISDLGKATIKDPRCPVLLESSLRLYIT
jgi:hypothetical protein